MVEPLSKKPLHIGTGNDRFVRVLAGNHNGDGFHALTFSETEIQGVMDLQDNRSALVLRFGAEIPVALSYEELEQKVYSPNIRSDDSSVLDLRAVTGDVAKPKVPANTNQASERGDKMADGTVFAGISPDNGEPMYATPFDAPLTMTFNPAADYANKLGHDDWRVPSKNELNVLFNNRAKIGGFNVSGSCPAGWYWSATPNVKWLAWGQRFSDGAPSFQAMGSAGGQKPSTTCRSSPFSAHALRNPAARRE